MSISVIIPVYNTGSYLKKCVQSICMQTYRELEILLVDDGSTDDSLLIMNQLAAQDERVRVLAREHQGVSATRNVGINVANGEYLSFIDSDDWIEPDMYEKLMYVACKYDADAVYCDWICEYSDGTSDIPQYKGQLEVLQENQVLEGYLRRGIGARVSSSIVRRKTVGTERFPENLERGEDMLFGFRLTCNAICVVDTDMPLYHRYYRLGSLTNRTNFRAADMGRAECTDYIVDYVKENKPEYLDWACARSFNFYMIVLNRMLYFGAEKDFPDMYTRIVQRLSALYAMMENKDRLRKELRYAYFTFGHAKEVYRLIDRIYYKYIKKELGGKRQR